MGYNDYHDDYDDYEDDYEEYEDDEDYVDDDEDTSGRLITGRFSAFSRDDGPGGGLPGSSNRLSSFTSGGSLGDLRSRITSATDGGRGDTGGFRAGRYADDDDDEEDTGPISGLGVQPFNRSSSPPPRSSSAVTRSVGRKPFSPGSGDDDAQDQGGGRSSFGGFTSSSSSSSSVISKSTPQSPKPSSADKGGGGGGFFRRGKSDDKKDDKKPAAKDDKSGGGGAFSSLPFGRGKSDDKKPADKPKDDKSGGGGAFSSLPFGRGKSDDKKPANKPKDDKSGGGGAFSSLGLGRGKSDDKKDDKKPAAKDDKSGGGLFRRGKSDDKKDDKKPAAKDDKSGGGRSPFGGFRRGSGGDAPARPESKPVPAAASSATTKPQSGGRQSPFGRSRTTGDDKGSKAAAATTAAAGGGFLGRFFGGGDKQPKSQRQRQSKVPTAESDGLTLDNWLDILGVGLVFGSLVLFFSAISAEQAAISFLHEFFGELLGWGALAVPVTMFLSGMWLIVRHFGEDAPTIDPIRVVGIVIIFVGALVIFQYIDSFNYTGIYAEDPAIMRRLLEERLRYAWENQHAGGGVIGATIYLALVDNVTEIGGFFFVLLGLLIGAMLMTRRMPSDIALFVVGSWRGLRDVMRQRAETRRARKRELEFKLAQEQQARAEAPAAETPGTQPAIAGVTPPESERTIRFNRGGERGPNMAPAAPAGGQTPPVPQPQAEANDGKSGGILGRLRRGKPDQQTGVGVLGIVGSGANANGSNTPPLPPDLPENPLPLDDDAASSPAVPSIGDVANGNWADSGPTIQPMINPRTQGLGATPPATPQPGQPAAQNPPAADQDEPVSYDDALRAQQARIDALRRGEAGPLSQPPAPRQQPESGAGYSPFGRPADRITHPTENLPYADRQQPAAQDSGTRPSQLPSAQPRGDEGKPHQHHLAEAPRINTPQPVSSPVQRQTPRAQWRLPDFRTLLATGSEQEFDKEMLLRQAKIIEDTLEAFGAPGRVVEVNTGPVITQFGVEPDYLSGRGGRRQRVKVSAIAALDRDLQLALGARSIRIEAPVPGKGYVGIEIPNEESTLVSLRDVMEDNSFQKIKSPLAIALGQSVSGAPISADLADMPHLLIAGTTGSGKSVCVNSIIASILGRNTPDVVKFIMVDPKRVELTGYNGIPHLVAPVVVELERIVGVLKWVTREMDDRYKRFSDKGARNIEDFNKHLEPTEERMPYIIVIIDELADLMMLAPEETERTITRIAALARATGIHLVIATQRPSVDVVTGLIKANFPARIAFAVASGTDSRVILDQPGAERLLGKGDMLYLSGNSPAPARLQGVFVSDMEINNIVRYWKMQAVNQPQPKPITMLPQATAAPDEVAKEVKPRGERVKQQAFWDNPPDNNLPDDFGRDVELDEAALTGDDGHDDELYEQAVELVRRLDKASISLLQRRLRIGYTRAARLIDVMEARGVVGPAKEGSSKPRDVLPSP